MTAKVTDTGRSALWSSGKSTFLYLAVGTGLNTVNETVTALATELSRVAVTQYQDGDVLELTAYFAPGQGNGTLTEWGIFTASSGGSCLLYGDMQGMSGATLNSSTSRYELTKTNTKNLTIDVVIPLENG